MVIWILFNLGSGLCMKHKMQHHNKLCLLRHGGEKYAPFILFRNLGSLCYYQTWNSSMPFTEIGDWGTVLQRFHSSFSCWFQKIVTGQERQYNGLQYISLLFNSLPSMLKQLYIASGRGHLQIQDTASSKCCIMTPGHKKYSQNLVPNVKTFSVWLRRNRLKLNLSKIKLLFVH